MLYLPQLVAVDRAIRTAIAREIELARKKEEEEARERERIAAAKAKAENKPAPTTTASKPKTSNELLRATPEAAKLSDAFEANRGSLPSPVASGYITAKFGAYKVGQASAQNNGVTFQTSEGAAVRAVFNGKVSRIVDIMGKQAVMIRHGEYFTVYTNLKSVSVSQGENVSTKQTIGVAATEDGVPEVGFQLLRSSVFQNPESWLAR